MYNIKARIYPEFDKTQKNGICNYIRALVKQNLHLTCSEILNKFIQDEQYYLKLNTSRFPFLSEVIENNDFLKDTEDYITECFKYYKYKESQKPLIEKQKEFDKKKRKFLQELKMSKEQPTNKQLYYYDKLCKKYLINKKDTNSLSKLDIRDEIERILNEHTEHYQNDD